MKSPPSSHLLALEHLGQLEGAEALPLDEEQHLSITLTQHCQRLVNHVLLGGHRLRLQIIDRRSRRCDPPRHPGDAAIVSCWR